MVEDFVRERGYLTLGTRLKRAGERLQADVSRLAKAEGVEVPAPQLTILGALDRHGPVTVGSLARMLGAAQPGVTRNLALLEKQGLVASAKQTEDQRQRMVMLSPQGANLVARTKLDLEPRVERAVAAICAGLEGAILEQLAGLEAALDRSPLDRRAARPRAGKGGRR